jgi:hypothetical protein
MMMIILCLLGGCNCKNDCSVIVIIIFVSGMDQSVLRRTTGWMGEESQFDSWQREDNFIFSQWTDWIWGAGNTL